jgi:hypothetical protein
VRYCPNCSNATSIRRRVVNIAAGQTARRTALWLKIVELFYNSNSNVYITRNG